MSTEQSRDDRGRFASGGNAGEQQARAAGRFPVGPHDGQRSMASHPGSSVVTVDQKTGARTTVAGGRRLAVAESIARGIRADKGFAQVK